MTARIQAGLKRDHVALQEKAFGATFASLINVKYSSCPAASAFPLISAASLRLAATACIFSFLPVLLLVWNRKLKLNDFLCRRFGVSKNATLVLKKEQLFFGYEQRPSRKKHFRFFCCFFFFFTQLSAYVIWTLREHGSQEHLKLNRRPSTSDLQWLKQERAGRGNRGSGK